MWRFCFVRLRFAPNPWMTNLPKSAPSLKDGNGETVHGQSYGKAPDANSHIWGRAFAGDAFVPERHRSHIRVLSMRAAKRKNTKMSEITIRRRVKKSYIRVDLDNLLVEGKPIPKLADGDIVRCRLELAKRNPGSFYADWRFHGLTGRIIRDRRNCPVSA